MLSVTVLARLLRARHVILSGRYGWATCVFILTLSYLVMSPPYSLSLRRLVSLC